MTLNDARPTGPAYDYRAVCRRVIDGDTFVADVDLGFRVTAAVTVRLRGVNAPEHNKPGGPDARDFLRETLNDPFSAPPGIQPTPLLLRSYHDEQSFARWICDVWLDAPNTPALAERIIEAGHGEAFDPKTDHWTR